MQADKETKKETEKKAQLFGKHSFLVDVKSYTNRTTCCVQTATFRMSMQGDIFLITHKASEK